MYKWISSLPHSSTSKVIHPPLIRFFCSFASPLAHVWQRCSWYSENDDIAADAAPPVSMVIEVLVAPVHSSLHTLLVHPFLLFLSRLSSYDGHSVHLFTLLLSYFSLPSSTIFLPLPPSYLPRVLCTPRTIPLLLPPLDASTPKPCSISHHPHLPPSPSLYF